MSETERKTLAEVLADAAEGARIDRPGGVAVLVVPGALEVTLGADVDESDVRLCVREALAWAAQQARDDRPDEPAPVPDELARVIAIDMKQVEGDEAEFTADRVLARYASGRLANTGPGFAALALEVVQLRVEAERMRPIVAAAERYVNALDEPDPGIAEAVGAAWRAQREDHRPKAPDIYACTRLVCGERGGYTSTKVCTGCGHETSRLANGGEPGSVLFERVVTAVLPGQLPVTIRDGDRLTVEYGPNGSPALVRVDAGKAPGDGGA